MNMPSRRACIRAARHAKHVAECIWLVHHAFVEAVSGMILGVIVILVVGEVADWLGGGE